MAYDQSQPYSRPQRPYLPQSQPQSPIRTGYDEFAASPYGQQDVYAQQSHDQYPQQYAGHNDYRQDTNYPLQEPQYSNGHYGGYQQQREQDQYMNQNYQQPQERYDPRYQQRGPRGPAQGRNQHEEVRVQQPERRPQQEKSLPRVNDQYAEQRVAQSERRPPQERDPYTQARRDPQSQPVHKPRQSHEQQSAALVAPPRVQGNGVAPKQAVPAHQTQKPGKMTMSEWKAKEKAKLHADALSPETIPQDNAFPTFPRKKDRLAPDRSGGASAMSNRSSDEHARPQTAASQRPAASRDNSFNKEGPVGEAKPPAIRTADGHQYLSEPPPSNMTNNSRMNASTQIPRQQQDRPAYDQQTSRPQEASARANPPEMAHPEQWPMVDQQIKRKPPPEQRARSPHQPHDSGYAPHPSDPRREGHSDSYAQLANAKQPPAPRNVRVPPQVQPIDTRQAQQQQRPLRSDRQPLSPAYIPPRPSTSQEPRSAVESRVTSPLSPQSHSQYPAVAHAGYGGFTQQAPKPWLEKQRTKHESLGDVYDDYNNTPMSQAAPAARALHTREEEIEAEMPDFDSAAPGQTSSLHKRIQTVDRHLQEPTGVSQQPPMPQMPPQHFDGATRSMPSRNDQFHEPQYGQQSQFRPDSSRSRPSQGNSTNGYVPNGPEYSSPQYEQGERPFEYQQPPMQNSGYQQAPGHMPPPSAPYASEPPVRRSMDDGRRMPQQQYNYAQDQRPLRQPNMPPPSAPYANEPPVRRSMDDGRRMPQRQDSYTQDQQPLYQPNLPYANEQPVRRSADDVRQLPHRQNAPQTQRMHPNGQPPNGYRPPPQPVQRPDFDRNFSGQTVWSDPGQQRSPPAIPVNQTLRAPPAAAATGAPLAKQRSAPERQQTQDSNPDALPHHPTPVRPGLMETGAPPPAKPPPVRNYNNSSTPSASAPANSSPVRKGSLDVSGQPITYAELERLRGAVEKAPMNYKLGLVLVKRLVEAASVLASEGGRADAKTTAKNREKYIMEAYKRVKKLVSAGYPEAQFYLADCYGQGTLGLESDTKEAFNLYQAAAKAGHPQAAYRTAVCCEMGPDEGGGTRKDPAKAVQWYRRAAALGDAAAMYKLGVVLLKGLLGEPRNVGEAAIWLKRAVERADRDNPHSLHELATLHESANTSPEVRNKIIADDKYARELFQKAADLGYKFSQFRLGQAYEYGTLGFPVDNRASITWYTKAAAQGEHQAELALSGWYLTGAAGILEHNDTEAYLWARKAAQSEPPLAKAMFAMGYFTETGIGCPANLEEAKKWYGRAAAYRFPKALERLEDLKKNGGKGARGPPGSGKLSRKDQKRDESECVVM